MDENLLALIKEYRDFLRRTFRLGDKEEIWFAFFCDRSCGVMSETWVFDSWPNYDFENVKAVLNKKMEQN